MGPGSPLGPTGPGRPGDPYGRTAGRSQSLSLRYPCRPALLSLRARGYTAPITGPQRAPLNTHRHAGGSSVSIFPSGTITTRRSRLPRLPLRGESSVRGLPADSRAPEPGPDPQDSPLVQANPVPLEDPAGNKSDVRGTWRAGDPGGQGLHVPAGASLTTRPEGPGGPGSPTAPVGPGGPWRKQELRAVPTPPSSL